MIPSSSIAAWREVVPWSTALQIEKDLIISRALVAIYSDSDLSAQLRFRGGTALHKLHLPTPMRFSEDIDLVRTESGPIGPVIDRLRLALEPWLGPGRFAQSQIAPKLRFRTEANDSNQTLIQLKVEINTRETQAYDGSHFRQFKVTNPWFTGDASIQTYTSEEMLATKLRALLQRDKGRDLFDLAHALNVVESVDLESVVTMFYRYLKASDLSISRAQAQQRMFSKLNNPDFWQDVEDLLPPEFVNRQKVNYQKELFRSVFVDLIDRLEGNVWVRTPEYLERFGIDL